MEDDDSAFKTAVAAAATGVCVPCAVDDVYRVVPSWDAGRHEYDLRREMRATKRPDETWEQYYDEARRTFYSDW
jgi:hypothetical protein